MLGLILAALFSVTTMPSPWPRAVPPAPNGVPVILETWLSSTNLVPGADWSGRIATSTDVAAIEVRTESFSFNADHVALGQFVFRQHILDIVAQYKRPYTLRIVAHAQNGKTSEQRIPIVLH
jgi:hypothetical protein